MRVWLAALPLMLATGAHAQPTPAVEDPETADLLRAAQQLGKVFAAVAKRAVPAVVNVNTTTVVPGREMADPFSFLDGFFGRRSRRYRTPDREVHSLGSGVIVSPDGWIVTNNHVIAGADEITVSLEDGREFEATRRGSDSETDLAVLRVSATDLPSLSWGDSSRLEVGEWVVAVGNPFGFSNSVSAGIVSAKGRIEIADSPLQQLIQTDAAVNPGSSGGALVNLSAELIGINTSIYSQTGAYQGISFAVPADVARDVVQQLIKDGEIPRGWIGADAADYARISGRRPGSDGSRVIVTALYRNAPAHVGGVRSRDIILSFNGKPIKSLQELRQAIVTAPLGETASIEVRRNERTVELEVQVIPRPTDRQGRAARGI